MPLTAEQFKKAQASGFSTDQIIGFEKKRSAPSVGRRVSDIPESEFTPKNPYWEAAKETRNTINRSGGAMMSAFGQMLQHPINTLSGLEDVGFGAVQHMILPKEMNTQEKQIASQVAQDYRQHYGGIDQIAETVSNDPFRFLGDVSAIAGGAGAASKFVGGGIHAAESANFAKSGMVGPVKGAGARLIEAGSTPTFSKLAKAATAPITQLISKGGKIGEKAALAVKETPEKLAKQATDEYRQILNPNAGEIRNIEIRKGKNIDDYYELAAEEQLTFSKTAEGKIDTLAAREKLKPKQQQLNSQLDFELSQNPSKQFDLMVIGRQAKNELRRTIKNDVEYKKVARDVDRQINETMALKGRMLNGQDLNKFKQGLWSVGYDQLRPTAQSTARKIGFIAKEAIEKAYPKANIKNLNELSGKYATLQHLLENASTKVVKGGRLGGYAAKGIGAIAGAKLPVIGAPLGAWAGGKFSNAIYDPARTSAIAASKAGKAGMAGRSFNKIMNAKEAEMVYPPIKGGPTNRLLPYNTTGLPNLSAEGRGAPNVNSVVPPFSQSGSTIYGENPYKVNQLPFYRKLTTEPYSGTTLPVPVQTPRAGSPDFKTQGKMKPSGKILRSPERSVPRETIVEVPSSAQDIKIPQFGIKGKKGTSKEIDAFVKKATPAHVKALERELAIEREKAARLFAQGKEKEAAEVAYGQVSAINETLRKSKAKIKRDLDIDASNLEVVDYGGAKGKMADLPDYYAAMLDAAEKSGDPSLITAVNKAIGDYMQSPRKNKTKEFLKRNAHEKK